MNDLRQLFAAILNQKPMEEDEFAKLSRLDRLYYYPVAKGYKEQAIKQMAPTPQTINNATRSNFQHVIDADRNAENMLLEIGQLTQQPKHQTAGQIARYHRDQWFKDMEEELKRRQSRTY